MGEILKAAGCDYGNGKCCGDGSKQVVVLPAWIKKKKLSDLSKKKKQNC